MPVCAALPVRGAPAPSLWRRCPVCAACPGPWRPASVWAPCPVCAAPHPLLRLWACPSVCAPRLCALPRCGALPVPRRPAPSVAPAPAPCPVPRAPAPSAAPCPVCGALPTSRGPCPCRRGALPRRSRLPRRAPCPVPVAARPQSAAPCPVRCALPRPAPCPPIRGALPTVPTAPLPRDRRQKPCHRPAGAPCPVRRRPRATRPYPSPARGYRLLAGGSSAGSEEQTHNGQQKKREKKKKPEKKRASKKTKKRQKTKQHRPTARGRASPHGSGLTPWPKKTTKTKLRVGASPAGSRASRTPSRSGGSSGLGAPCARRCLGHYKKKKKKTLGRRFPARAGRVHWAPYPRAVVGGLARPAGVRVPAARGPARPARRRMPRPGLPKGITRTLRARPPVVGLLGRVRAPRPRGGSAGFLPDRVRGSPAGSGLRRVRAPRPGVQGSPACPVRARVGSGRPCWPRSGLPPLCGPSGLLRPGPGLPRQGPGSPARFRAPLPGRRAPPPAPGFSAGSAAAPMPGPGPPPSGLSPPGSAASPRRVRASRPAGPGCCFSGPALPAVAPFAPLWRLPSPRARPVCGPCPAVLPLLSVLPPCLLFPIVCACCLLLFFFPVTTLFLPLSLLFLRAPSSLVLSPPPFSTSFPYPPVPPPPAFSPGARRPPLSRGPPAPLLCASVLPGPGAGSLLEAGGRRSAYWCPARLDVVVGRSGPLLSSCRPALGVSRAAAVIALWPAARRPPRLAGPAPVSPVVRPPRGVLAWPLPPARSSPRLPPRFVNVVPTPLFLVPGSLRFLLRPAPCGRRRLRGRPRLPSAPCPPAPPVAAPLSLTLPPPPSRPTAHFSTSPTPHSLPYLPPNFGLSLPSLVISHPGSLPLVPVSLSPWGLSYNRCIRTERGLKTCLCTPPLSPHWLWFFLPVKD
ncbi:unnamed protein product [Pleuronectes platessa]|uniref:Uncharacterized protein n=1 Tax=Pleuronectes platessa TaxID=8262 RepID=A0A9N7Z7D9_PLEPL|nr:unnamed protein product [Pleuronectes platessa]